MWVRLGSVESESTKLVPFKALAMAPSHVPGIGELQSMSDCCRAFQVEPWVHTERVLQCLLQHICCSLGRVGCFDVSMCGGDEKAGCSRWAEGRCTLCPCNMEEEILEGRNLKDETFPQLFRANGFEASPRSALEVQSSQQESGSGAMSVLGWKLSFAASSAAVL